MLFRFFIWSKQGSTSQCLNLLLVGSKKVWIPQKWCLTTYINFLGYSKFKFLYLDLFLDFWGGHFWAQKAKNDQKIKIVHFHYFSCWKFFWTQFLSIFFFWMATIYTGKFFISTKSLIWKKESKFFFKNFPLVPPMDVFSSFGGPRVVAADLSCSRVASVHCDFVGVCGGAVFWPEKDFLKRANLSLGEILTRHRYIY